MNYRIISIGNTHIVEFHTDFRKFRLNEESIKIRISNSVRLGLDATVEQYALKDLQLKLKETNGN